MKIIQFSDTHGKHHLLKNLPEGDVLVHCGDFTEDGTEDEVLDFLNWFMVLPHPHKIFVTGNHDLCLWDAENIEGLPDNVYFLQDRGITIDGVRFFGIAYNHPTGITQSRDTIFSNGSVLNDVGELRFLPKVYEI